MKNKLKIIKKYTIQFYLYAMIFIILCLGIGFFYWNINNSKNQEKSYNSSRLYQIILLNSLNNNKFLVLKNIEKLISLYPNSIYSIFAHFIQSRYLVEDHKYIKAIKSLKWIIHHSLIEDLKIIASIRLIRIFIDLNYPKKKIFSIMEYIDKKNYFEILNIFQKYIYYKEKNFKEIKKISEKIISKKNNNLQNIFSNYYQNFC